LGFGIEDEQGPATPLAFYIAAESGLAVKETFFDQQLKEKGMPKQVLEAANEVEDLFRLRKEDECFLAMERLFITCEENEVPFSRTAGVGRLPFFFIRPAETSTGPLKLPLSLVEGISREAIAKIEDIEHAARIAANSIREGTVDSLEEAISLGRNLFSYPRTLRGEPLTHEIIYCQPDVILRSDGSFEIERVNLPDVGLFLTQIEAQDPVFLQIQGIAGQLARVVTKKIAAEIRRNDVRSACILTRDSVLSNGEDTLEIREIEALKKHLLGIDIEVRRLSEAEELPENTFVLLLNVNPGEQGFNNLLIRFARQELQCYPNPFTLLFKDSVSTLPKRKLVQRERDIIRAIADPTRNTPEDYLRQLLALDGFLNKLGFRDENIFYVYGNNRERPAAAFRYDPVGFTLALKSFSGQSEVFLEGLKFLPGDAVIMGADGPRLAAFRFMCVKN